MATEGAEVLSRRPDVIFATRDIPPPTAFYIVKDDVLHITIWNSVATALLVFGARILMPSGEIVIHSTELRPTADRIINRFNLRLPEGFLLTCEVHTSDIFQPGQCWIRGSVLRGALATGGANFNVAELFSGWIFLEHFPSFPYGRPGPADYARGAIRSITGTDPAANVEVSETVPTNAVWRLLALAVTLDTDATVANRDVTLALDDGTTIFWRSTVMRREIANELILYTFGAGYSPVVQAVADPTAGSLPVRMLLREGFRIRTITTGLQAGDDFTAPQLLVEEWAEQ